MVICTLGTKADVCVEYAQDLSDGVDENVEKSTMHPELQRKLAQF